MSETNRPIFEQDATRGDAAHNKLNIIHQHILHKIGAKNLSGHYGDWKIVLGTAKNGQLNAASAVRLGQEAYSFERIEDKTWVATGERHQFEETHFFNVANLAFLAWKSELDETTRQKLK